MTWWNSVPNLNAIEQSAAKLLRFKWPNDLWPVDLELLQHFWCHAFKLCAKFEQSLTIHGWVIDDLARFRGWCTADNAFSGVRGPNLTKLGGDIERSSQHRTFALELGYLAAFSNANGSELNYVENMQNFALFAPPPWKLEEGLARSMHQLLKLYLRRYDRTFGYICWPHTVRLLSAVYWLLENVTIANALQLEAARATTALCRFNYDAVPSLMSPNLPLPYYRIFAADTLRYDLWPCDLDLWPLFNLVAAYRLRRDEALYQIWT